MILVSTMIICKNQQSNFSSFNFANWIKKNEFLQLWWVLGCWWWYRHTSAAIAQFQYLFLLSLWQLMEQCRPVISGTDWTSRPTFQAPYLASRTLSVPLAVTWVVSWLAHWLTTINVTPAGVWSFGFLQSFTVQERVYFSSSVQERCNIGTTWKKERLKHLLKTKPTSL